MDSLWADSTLKLIIEGEPTIARFTQATEAMAGLLREVSERMSGRSRTPVRWVVSAVEKGSLVLEIHGEPATDEIAPAVVPSIIAAVTSGVAAIQQQPTRPPYFSDAALESAKSLAELVHQPGGGVSGITVRNGGAGVPLTRQVAVNVDELIGPKLESYGTVEGRLEAITIHGRQQFAVYQALDGHRVRCLFAQRIELSTVIAAFGRRVGVSGLIRSRVTGERVEVIADDLWVFPHEAELPNPERALGILSETK